MNRRPHSLSTYVTAPRTRTGHPWRAISSDNARTSGIVVSSRDSRAIPAGSFRHPPASASAGNRIARTAKVVGRDGTSRPDAGAEDLSKRRGQQTRVVVCTPCPGSFAAATDVARAYVSLYNFSAD